MNACPFCDITLTDVDLTDGWCDNCGKKLPDAVVYEATHSRSHPARARPPKPMRRDAHRDDDGPADEPHAGARVEAPAVDAPVGTRRTTVALRGRDERITQRLPGCCMCCGARSTLHKEKKFAWYPAWIFLLAPLGGVPMLIGLLIARKMMTVRIPLCDRHRFPWLRQNLVLALVLVYMLVLPWVLMILSVMAEKELGRGNALSLTLLIGWFVGFPLLFGVALWVKRRSIHAKRITGEEMVLGGVSDAFAARVN